MKPNKLQEAKIYISKLLKEIDDSDAPSQDITDKPAKTANQLGKKFLKLSLPEKNVIDITQVVDQNQNKWREVIQYIYKQICSFDKIRYNDGLMR